MIIYISGKYTGKTEAETIENIAAARKVAVELWEKGFTVICPHLNTSLFETDCNVDYATYLKGYLEILARCDAMILLPNWEQSEGANIEYDFAVAHYIPVYTYPSILPEISIVEKQCPQQTTAFMDTLMNMYKMYLWKNQDYGTAPILGTGEIGLVTRMWDKMSRIMHLTGFNIDVNISEFSPPVNSPKYESLMDSFKDIAAYSIIAQLYKNGDWGK